MTAPPLCYAIKIDGTLVEVYVAARAMAANEEMLGFVFRARAPGLPGTPHGRPQTLQVARSAIHQRRWRLSAAYWRPWDHVDGPQASTNAGAPPVGLVAGGSAPDASGALWLALAAAPAETLPAPLGSWAVEVHTGRVWRRVRGHLEKLAEAVAEELASDIKLRAEMLGLPTVEE